MTNALAAAECAIYAILALPVLYTLIKHGRNGFLGWLFLFLFCGIRVVGGGLAVKNSSGAASIISSVGLSPILLATSGILHEARILRIPNLNKKFEWVLALFYHILVVGGVALTAAGSAKLQKTDQTADDMHKAERIVKVGMAVLTLSWIALVGWTGISFTGPRPRSDRVGNAGSTLLKTIVFSLFFIGVRVFYSLVALCSEKASLNPTTGSLAIRVVLSFLPELIATLAYIAAGIKTRDVAELTANAETAHWETQKPAPWV